MFPTVDAEELSLCTSPSRVAGVSGDVPPTSETTEVKYQSNRELTLNMLIKELVFCIALAMTTYAALHNSPTKVSKHPQAVRFFNSNSVVVDWYRGQLGHALAAINREDVSFVMYYAPWDAESQYVRNEFEKAANVLSDRIHFSAINCWNPGSECRLQHNKIPSWPILMAYTITSRGVLYKGPRDAHSMVNFLELIMRPLQRVSTTEDLVNLLSICDAVAVGFTPISDTSKYYNVWYTVALKAKEFDTIGEICFAVVTSEELAIDLGVETLPNARIMLWNDTKEYMLEDVDSAASGWNESSLVPWVLERFTQAVARVVPLWRKAFSFDRYLDGNPLLLLFTPLNPLYQQIPAYALLREIAMEYYNCKNNESAQWISELIKLQRVQRLVYQQKDLMSICKEFKFKKPTAKRFKKSIVSNNNKYPWNNSTNRNQKREVFSFFRGVDITKMIDSSGESIPLLGLLDVCSSKVLPAEKDFYENYEQCASVDENLTVEDELDKEIEDLETTMLPYEDDPYSPENLIQEDVNHFCKLMSFARELGAPVIPSRATGNITNVEGLACEKNFTLNMIAVDSVQNYHFAESLGIDIKRKKDMTAVVILDSKHESQYVLSGEYTAQSMREFITAYTRGALARSPRLRERTPTHTHYYSTSDARDAHDAHVHIDELTTRGFRKYLRTTGAVRIVLVCDGVCPWWATRAVAGAVRASSAAALHVRAARVDGRAHDLPAHYAPHSLPAVIVLPQDRNGDGDSRSYPVGSRMTTAGVLALVLRALPHRQHLRARLALCHNAQSSLDKKTCLKDMRHYIVGVIGRNLKYWRRTDSKQLRDALFRRLQYLHRVYLDLSVLYIEDLCKNNFRQKTLLESLSLLSANWNIDESLLRKNVTQSNSKS